MGISTKQNLLKLNHPSTLKTLLILLVLVGFTFGQSSAEKDCNCKDDKKTVKKSWQTNKKKDKKISSVRGRIRVRSQNNYQTNSTRSQNNYRTTGDSKKKDTLEKSISVDPEKVFIQVCVTQGQVKINGWNRKEVRAFVKNSEGLGIRVREKSVREKKPVWLDIVGYDPNSRYERRSRTNKPYDKCLSGDIIELDVPQYADIKINVRSGNASVDQVNSAKMTVIDGDIDINNIKQSTEVHTHQGSITVRNSGGQMTATTTTGNIIAYNTESNEIGDYFKAKTRSGSVTLQSVGQKEVEATSVSGTLNFVGAIKDYGQYGFSTTNGLINMILPADSSFRLTATYGGAFRSDLALSDINKSRTSSIVYLTGRVGRGNANVNLRSYNGTIQIKKQNVRLAKLFRYF